SLGRTDHLPAQPIEPAHALGPVNRGRKKNPGGGGPDFEAPTKGVHRGPSEGLRAGTRCLSQPEGLPTGRKNNGLGEATAGRGQPRRNAAARWSREPARPLVDSLKCRPHARREEIPLTPSVRPTLARRGSSINP